MITPINNNLNVKAGKCFLKKTTQKTEKLKNERNVDDRNVTKSLDLQPKNTILIQKGKKIWKKGTNITQT